MKEFTSGSDDQETARHCKNRAIFSQNGIRSTPKMKIKEKTKLKTIEDIPLEELGSGIRVEGELIIAVILYAENHMQHFICYISNTIL